MCMINFNKARWWGGPHWELLDNYIDYLADGRENDFWSLWNDEAAWDCAMQLDDGVSHRIEGNINTAYGKVPSCHVGTYRRLARIEAFK